MARDEARHIPRRARPNRHLWSQGVGDDRNNQVPNSSGRDEAFQSVAGMTGLVGWEEVTLRGDSGG